MTDHNTDTHTTNDCSIYRCVYFLAIIILIPTGLLHGPWVLFQIGIGLVLLPFAAGTLASAFILIAFAICHPVQGAIMAFVVVNITMIAMHDCPISFLFFPFSCAVAVDIPILLFSIGYLCQTSYYQRKAVVREAAVVHRFTEETTTATIQHRHNSNNSASSLDYYWVGEYEAPSSLQYVTPNNGDEKQSTSIQLFHNNGNQQHGAVEKNGLEECSCTEEEEEEEEVCYKIQQQRFHKKFMVTVDLYQATSLEVLVLPGRPNSAMLSKPLEKDRCISKWIPIFLIIHAGGFSFLGVVMPLKRLIDNSKDTYGQDDDYILCPHMEWQTYVPYITLVVMVMLAVSNFVWNRYQMGEFAAVTVHNPAGGEQELVTVVGLQNKMEEDEYHHHSNDDDDKTETETETACTSRELDNDDETACTRELDNDDDTTYIRETVGTGRNRTFLV